MSSELEQRLEGLLAEAPEPEPGAGEEALHRALRELQPGAPPRRGLRTAVLVFAAIAVLLAIAAGSLAAVGALHVSFGATKQTAAEVTSLRLLAGSAGIDAVVNGRLSVVTKSGFRLQGLPVSAAALSPHAYFVAAGIGESLVAMRPDGRRAWSQPMGGTVVAIAWAPFGNRIAYIAHAGKRFALHLIWGNGTHDTVIDRSVRAVRPSWRADSLAFAYVGAGGRAIVYDLSHENRGLVAVGGPVTGVAFAPTGDSIAIRQPSGIWLLHQSAASHFPGQVESFGWFGERLAVVQPGLDSAVIRLFSLAGAPRGASSVRGIVVTVTPKLVVVRRTRNLISGDTVLLTVPRGATVRSVEIR
jgi:hypothetical protein